MRPCRISGFKKKLPKNIFLLQQILKHCERRCLDGWLFKERCAHFRSGVENQLKGTYEFFLLRNNSQKNLARKKKDSFISRKNSQKKYFPIKAEGKQKKCRPGTKKKVARKNGTFSNQYGSQTKKEFLSKEKTREKNLGSQLGRRKTG